MKEIILSQGKIALIDDEDFDRVSKHKWSAKYDKNSKTFYAITGHKKDNARWTTILMHRFILGITDSEIHVDHEDHNGLNNQKYNIRRCTRSQNRANARKYKGTSIYKGIYWNKSNSKWMAKIKINQKQIYLGVFCSEVEAHAAYCVASEKAFGTFSYSGKM